jgi:site-specific DNA recombinase
LFALGEIRAIQSREVTRLLYSHGNTVSDAPRSVRRVAWRQHLKELFLDDGSRVKLPRSACVSSGDSVVLDEGGSYVLCKNGSARILPTYVALERVSVGSLNLELVVKEITELEEFHAYEALTQFHYRGHTLFGRTARLVVRNFHPIYPKVIGYIELTTPFYMNKARAALLDALERPGLDQVRKMVAAGEVEAVVVLFRDRIARGVYAQLLAEEFRQHGARLIALNSRGDDSPDGELGDNTLDVVAAWERKKIAERMNGGKRRKAREGKIVAGPRPHYGFRFNEARDGYLIDEEKMAVVRRIFCMVGSEGLALNRVRHTLEREGVTTSSGRRGWSRTYLRRCINDVYLSHTFEEVRAIVSPEVASTLDPSRSYGVWWYGRERHIYTQRRDIAADGTPSYKRAKRSVPAAREDRVAVPVPDAGIPKEWVLAAREAIKDNVWTSRAGDRVWELAGGVLRCAECGRAMSVNYIRARDRGYYRCAGCYNGGLENPCSMSRTIRAEEVGARVWDFVSEILANPSNLARGLEKMIDNERSPSAAEDEAPWLKRIAEIDRKQERLLDLRLDGDVTPEQFRARSAELKDARAAAQDQLEASRSRLSRLKDLERSKDALVSHYAALVPQGLDELSPAERNQVYNMMNLRVFARPGSTLIADWGCNVSPLPPGNYRTRDT